MCYGTHPWHWLPSKHGTSPASSHSPLFNFTFSCEVISGFHFPSPAHFGALKQTEGLLSLELAPAVRLEGPTLGRCSEQVGSGGCRPGVQSHTGRGELAVTAGEGNCNPGKGQDKPGRVGLELELGSNMHLLCFLNVNTDTDVCAFNTYIFPGSVC